MALPEDFSPVEHLQDTLRKVYNREVKDWFSEIKTDDLDISTSRASLRTALLHQDADSLQTTLIRMVFFEFTMAQRWRQLAAAGDTTTLSDKVLRRTKPKVTLYFQEDLDDIEPGYGPVTGEISFRIMDESTTSLTPTKATQLAQKVKSEFVTGGGFVWKKGRNYYSYSDWAKGYQLQLLCRSETDAKALVGKVLDLQTHSPQWEYFNATENDQPATAFPTVPQKETILGKSRRLPRRRPVAAVRFQYALLHLAGLANPVCLVDRSGTWPDPVVDLF